MSAVSSRVMPSSSARSTTLRDASKSMRQPKLLHPNPTTETWRPELPSWRCFIEKPFAMWRREAVGYLHRRQARTGACNALDRRAERRHIGVYVISVQGEWAAKKARHAQTLKLPNEPNFGWHPLRCKRPAGEEGSSRRQAILGPRRWTSHPVLRFHHLPP